MDGMVFSDNTILAENQHSSCRFARRTWPPPHLWGLVGRWHPWTRQIRQGVQSHRPPRKRSLEMAQWRRLRQSDSLRVKAVPWSGAPRGKRTESVSWARDGCNPLRHWSPCACARCRFSRVCVCNFWCFSHILGRALCSEHVHGKATPWRVVMWLWIYCLRPCQGHPGIGDVPSCRHCSIL